MYGKTFHILPYIAFDARVCELLNSMLCMQNVFFLIIIFFIVLLNSGKLVFKDINEMIVNFLLLS